MTADSVGQVIPSEIKELLEKRLTFQAWLTKLDDLGPTFRPEVAGRVRADYRERLHQVEGELTTHRSELESSLAERRDQLAALSRQHDARAAELEEAELRYKVGEFEPDDWESRRDEHESALAELDSRVGTERDAVAELETVLSELTKPAAPRRVEAPSAPVETAPPVTPEAEPIVARAEAPVAEAEAETAPPSAGEPTLEASEASIEVPEGSSGVADVVAAEPTGPEGEGTRIVAEAEAETAETLTSDMGPGPEATAGLDEQERTSVAVGEPAGAPTAESPAAPAAEEPTATVGVADAGAEAPAEGGAEGEGESKEFLDELEFLEWLSLDDTESFDAVSVMLEEEEAPDAGSAESAAEEEHRTKDV